MQTLILTNSASPHYRDAIERVLPYCDHFGIAYVLWDLNTDPLPADPGKFALILAAHREIDIQGTGPGSVFLNAQDQARLQAAVQGGTGLVSFDPALASMVTAGGEGTPGRSQAERLRFEVEHYITTRHACGEQLRLFSPMQTDSALAGQALISADGHAFLTVASVGAGRVVRWGSGEWMDPAVLGPMEPLDQVLWRSLVWAARKPFALRGMPPIVTMRVDDVNGYGAHYGRSPLYWVKEANRHGFKPWLGIFLYNLTGNGIDELRELALSGDATVFPHALGRPPRRMLAEKVQQSVPVSPGPHNDADWYYAADALPVTDEDDYDQFIYWSHYRGRPFSDAEVQRRLEAVDRWFAKHAPMPMSKYALPHWYEMGNNVAAYMAEKWGVDTIGKPMQSDLPLEFSVDWLKLGPFRKYGEPGTCRPSGEERFSHRPLYYSDFVNLGGYRFYNSLTELRDVAAYEWEPNNEVEATIRRGVSQVTRALDSMALGVLFTHETDYIYKIQPENWEAIIKGVAEGIAPYNPIFMTLDEGVYYGRALRTSRLETCQYDAASKQVTAEFSGCADRTTHFYVFSEGGAGIQSSLVEVPAFTGQAQVTYKVR